jgi:hypothetical protein
MATDPTPFRLEHMAQIRELYRNIAPEAKIPEGTWFRQLEAYTQVLLGSIRRRLRRLSTEPAQSQTLMLRSEIESIRQELDVLDKCTEVLIEFAKEKG